MKPKKYPSTARAAGHALLACIVLVSALIPPLRAFAVSTWNPTLIVNTESFQQIDSGDGTTTVDLRFGTSSSTLTLLTTGKFRFNKSLSVQGGLSGSYLTIDQQANISGSLVVRRNVGIGTSSPQAPLHVSGSTIIFGPGENSTPNSVTVRGPAAAGSNTVGGSFTFDASNGTGNGGSGPFIFRTAPSAGGSGIAFDAASTTGGLSANSASWNHTTGAGSNRILIVGTSMYKFGVGAYSVTSLTYGGQALTKIRSDSSAGRTFTELWYLLDPPVGTASISLTYNQPYAGAMTAGAITLTGVDASPIDAQNGTAAASVNVTTATANAWVVDTIATEGVSGFSVGAGQTSRWNAQYGAASTEGPVASPGAVTMSWSGVSGDTAISAVAIKPLSNASANTLTERLRITPDGNVGIGKSVPTQKFDVVGTISGSRLSISNNANISGSLVIKNNLSGSALFSFGLGSCSNTTTSKLIYNSSTGKFSCGTDQNNPPWSNTGSLRAAFDTRYIKKSGDTMTGALKITKQNGYYTGALLNVLGTMSGRSLFITGSGGSASPLISANSGNGRVGIGKHIPTSAFDVVGTISGSRLSISNNANISGSLVIKNNLSGS
ncbi:MAG: hypothetical protein KBA40_00825, partial [Candidatus Peribacteraceae bacterium]|nr:hypothetical protein [Candidatus Peribacteraceae bacterium]